ncbi:hypothetical protein D3C80_2160850 [compost metagenome]
MKAACNQIIHGAMTLMINDVKAPIPMVMDRLFTFAAAQACKLDGSASTAAAFREFADKIDAGLFYSITGEGKKGH